MQYICSAVCSPKLDIQTDIGADFSMMLLFHTVFEFILSHVPRKSLLIPLAFTLRPGLTLNRKLATSVKYQPFSFRFLSEDWGEFENGGM